MFKILIVVLAAISAYIGISYRPEMTPAQTPIWFGFVLVVVIGSCLELHKFLANQNTKLLKGEDGN